MLLGFGLTYSTVMAVENTIIGLSLFFLICLPMIVIGSTLAGGSPKFIEDRLDMEVLENGNN